MPFKGRGGYITNEVERGVTAAKNALIFFQEKSILKLRFGFKNPHLNSFVSTSLGDSLFHAKLLVFCPEKSRSPYYIAGYIISLFLARLMADIFLVNQQRSRKCNKM